MMMLRNDYDILEYIGREDTDCIKLPITKLSGSLEVVHITSDNPNVDTVIFNSFRDHKAIYPNLTYSESYENLGNGCMVSLNPSDDQPVFSTIIPDPLESQGLLTIAEASPRNRKGLNVPDTKYTVTRLSVGDKFVCVEDDWQCVDIAINKEQTFGVVRWVGNGILGRLIPTPLFHNEPDFMAVKALDRSHGWHHWRSVKMRQVRPHSGEARHACCGDQSLEIDATGVRLNTEYCNIPGSFYHAYCFFGEDAANLGIDLF